jgi:hypothetical protein
MTDFDSRPPTEAELDNLWCSDTDCGHLMRDHWGDDNTCHCGCVGWAWFMPRDSAA